MHRVFTHPVPRDVHVNFCHCILAYFQCCYITTKLNTLFCPAFKNVFGQLDKDTNNEKRQSKTTIEVREHTVTSIKVL